MHDNCIISYSVDIGSELLVIKTRNNEKKTIEKIIFSGVLTHSFKCIINYNIIYDICNCEIGNFITENKKELVDMDGYCWPINYKDERELCNFLIKNNYKYIKINSSYGMFGWILAKSYEIIKE